MKSIKSLLVCTLLLTSLNISADVISGKIEFVKRPAFTGLLYVANTGNKDKHPMIDQKDKQFTNKITVGSPSNIVSFKNSDTLDHNVYASDKKQNVTFDIGLMAPQNSAEIAMDWSEESLVRIGCKIHPKMKSYVANVNTDFFHAFEFEKKIKSYEFEIQKVPAKEQTVVLLMPKYEKQTFTLKKGETKTIDIQNKGKTKATLTVSRS